MFLSLKINTHKFDKDKSEINRIKEIEIEVLFDFTLEDFSPIIVESEFDKLLSEHLVNSSIANSFKSSRVLISNKNSSWINFESEYVKIALSNDAIYNITGIDLKNIGFQLSSITPKTFQLFHNGIEIPIYVKGEEDDEFNDNDNIEFIGKKNYNNLSARIINEDSEPYNEYLNKYTDTNYYFLTWNKTNGMRTSSSSSFLTSEDTLNYHFEFLHLEENPRDALYYTFHSNIVQSQLPFWDTGKGWYWDWLANWRRQLNIKFNVKDLYENADVRFYGKIMSFGSDVALEAHKYNFEFKGITIDSTIANRFERTLLSGQLSAENLINGTNIVNLKYSNNNGGTTGSSVLDWVEVEYPQQLKFDSNSVHINFLHEISSGMKTIRVGNAEANSKYIIYKTVPEIKRYENYKIVDGYLFFSDSVSIGDEYIIISENTVLTPKVSKKKFINIQNTLKQVDYVAISHRNFIGTVENYVQVIQDGYGLRTEIVYIDDIYDEFGYGFPNAESIKDFIEFKLRNSPSPKPSYILLIGDGNYDYKNYRQKYDSVKGGQNLIPSYGFPVSDSWFAIFDDSILPEAFIGRIPVNLKEELEYYSQKVNNYINSDYSSWNKRAIFFSSGDGSNQSELDILKNANDRVIDEIISIPPLNSAVTHFYKSPSGDFGPFSSSKIKQVIDDGGLFISYIGHSGTSTWDNSIVDVSQLKSKTSKSPIITDFGCSTNKFAEPDIISFGERFLLDEDGEAICYIGNSALGFTSIATSAPFHFYSSLVFDEDKSIGAIHHKSKSSMFNYLGNTSIFGVYNFTNTLLGDPAIRIKVPQHPNFRIGNNNISILNESNLSTEIDSVIIALSLPNEGLVYNENIEINLQHYFEGDLLVDSIIIIPMPAVEDSLDFKFSIYGKSGIHKLSIIIDPKNKITEISEDDNIIDYKFYVFNNQLKDLLINDIENPFLQKIKILSPHKIKNSARLFFEKADNKDLINSSIEKFEIDSVYSEVNLVNNYWKRTWFRYGLETTDTVWSPVKSFLNKTSPGYFIDDSISFANQTIELLEIDSSLSVANKHISFGVVSAGSYAGANCIITENGKNLLKNTFFPGIGVAVIDKIQFTVDTVVSFELWNQPQTVRELTSFLNEIEAEKLIIMGVSFDAKNNMTDSLKNAIKLFGSSLIDSLKYKGSWCLIGGKNLNSNEIKEEIKDPYDGPASLISEFSLKNSTGYLQTNKIGPVTNWKNFLVQDSLPNNSAITYKPILISQTDNSEDTLAALNLVNGEALLKSIDAKEYPYIKILTEFEAGDNNTSPELYSFGVDYEGVPELATNYQVVSIEKDTLQQGEDANLSFYVYNVGESTADSFKVMVEVIKPDNSKEKIFEEVVDSIGSEKRKKFNISYLTTSFNGSRTFSISIDSDNKIMELYEDNNYYNIPFYVIGDTTKPSMNLTIDGNDIFDGEYISSNPEIKIELSDPSLIPITDTSSISIFLNNKYLSYTGNEEVLSINYSASNPKAVVNYKPTLEDGEYNLRVFGKDASGNVGDSSGITKNFNVESNAKLLNVYNYPNPFVDDTYFTFKLTQIPDEIKIKVFTIAGRLIKEFVLNNSQLNFDLNKIHWDGRDDDGDKVGNGVYLYKVIMDVEGKKTDVTQKLAVVR